MTKALAGALTFLLLATTIPAQEPNPPKDRSEAIRKLSRRERKARIAKLDVRHQDFVADVEPIMVDAELDLFLSLESDQERDSFVDEFWRRRDQMHRTAGAFKEMYYRRLDQARTDFKRITTDRARLFLLYGPPNEVVRANCPRMLQPTEIWKYAYLPGVGSNVRLLFYKPRHQNDYRLWNPVGGAIALADLIIAPDAMEGSAEQRRGPAGDASSSSPYSYVNRIQLECSDGNEIMLALSSMVQARVDLFKIFNPPGLNDEAVQKMMRSVVISNPNAPKLNAEFSVRYPAKDGSRTGVQMMVLVPRAELSPAEAGGVEMYTVDVTGEVLRDGNLFEKYRYRFDFPGDISTDRLPIVVDRLLRPADYVSRIKVTDAHSGAEAVIENPITVPEIFETAAAAPEAAPAGPPPAAAAVAAQPAAPQIADEDSKEPRLRIVPPSNEPVSGLQTIETMATGEGIKAVEFWLDGKKIAVRRAAPFTLDVDFGEVPRMRRIRTVAIGADNKPVTGDELTVNSGTDPFRIRIVSPRVSPRLSGLTRVELDVSVPDDDELATVELYWNQNRLATLYGPPFVQTIDIPGTDDIGYLRAVATLKDEGAAPVEDVVMFNTPAYMEQLNVHLVELPTTVLVNGKPSDALTEKAFKITDEGQPVQLAKFEYVKNLPLSIGMAIDSSGSMINRMEEAQKAGAQFFEKVMRKGDKAFLVAFDTEPQLLQSWSSRLADVHAGLARVRAEDKTALYDAVIYALYNFQGVRGQKALVLISDGKDTASKFTYEHALEYARRAGVPIYGVGIGIHAPDVDVRYKLDRLCRETGGTVYYIDQARELQRIYDDIQTELRSQYILGFYPSPDVKPGSKWREVTVQVNEGKARTVKGYFP